MEISNDVKNIFKMLNKINDDCLESGESYVPLIYENANYYIEQLSNLMYDRPIIDEFVRVLERADKCAELIITHIL